MPTRVKFAIAYIPECFNDPDFDRFEEKVKPGVKGGGDLANVRDDMTIAIVSKLEKNSDDCRTILEAFARSRFFQTHSKQIKSLSLKGFWLDDVTLKPFLETCIQREVKIYCLHLFSCHFTHDGARTFGWLLENEKSGFEIQEMQLDELTGDMLPWISVLHKNRTLKKITTRGLDCGLAFFDFIRQCNLYQYKFIRYHDGILQERNEHSLPYDSVSFSTGKKILFTTYESSLHFEMICNWGKIAICIGGKCNHDHNLHLCVADYVQRFQHLLSLFKKEQQAREIRATVNCSGLKGRERLFQTIATDGAPLKRLELNGCHLSEQDASHLGWLLDTDISMVNVEYLVIAVKGSTTWASGLYKNKSIRFLQLDGFDFLHSAVYMLQNGRASKLGEVDLVNLREEENGKPHGVNDGEKNEESIIDVKTSKTTEAKNHLTSLKEIKCRNERYIQLSRHLCESIGNMLRQSIHLETLELELVQQDPEYDFLKDAVWCQEICLKNTDFEPLCMTSLINGEQLKKLELEWGRDMDWEIFVELLKIADLTFLDQLRIVGFPSSEAILALSHHFGQNKGPCKFFRDYGYDEHSRVTKNDEFDIEDLQKMGAGLARNNKIKEFKLQTVLDLGPPELLEFLQSVFKMSSLTKLTLSDYLWENHRSYSLIDGEWRKTEKEELEEKAVECVKLILKLLVEKNIEFNCSPFYLSKSNCITVLARKFQRCKFLLRCDTNDFPDTLWTRVFVHAAKKNYPRFSWWHYSDEDEDDWWIPPQRATTETKDLLFYLVRQLPRLFQNGGEKKRKYRYLCPSFVVPHHPDCPACRKRKFCSLTPT